MSWRGTLGTVGRLIVCPASFAGIIGAESMEDCNDVSVGQAEVGERGEGSPQGGLASGRRICDVRMLMRQAVVPFGGWQNVKCIDTTPLLSATPLLSVPGILQKRGSNLIVDTGDAVDGRVPLEVLQAEARRGNAKKLPLLADGSVPPGLIPPMLFPAATWEGRIYRNVLIGPGPDLLSLRFLGRFRRVTFNFPKGRLYLDSGTE